MSTPQVFGQEKVVAGPGNYKEREAPVGYMNIRLKGSGKVGDTGIPIRQSAKVGAYLHDLYTQAVAAGNTDGFDTWLHPAIEVSYKSATPTGGAPVNAQELPEINFL